MKREYQPATTTDTAPVMFTRAELWLLQRVLRHEIQGAETWKYPPASVDLNDQIAAALLFCEEEAQDGATLLLSFGDCLAVDYCVPNDAKDVNGRPIGIHVLLKSYTARAALRRGYPIPEAEPVEEPAKATIKQRLDAAWYDEDAPRFE